MFRRIPVRVVSDNMQPQGSKVKIYCKITLILCAVCFAAYLVSFLLIRSGSDYFPAGNPLPKAAGALAIASVLWFLSALVLIPKNALPGDLPKGQKPCLIAGAPIIGSLVAGTIGFTYISPADLAAVLVGDRPIDATFLCTVLVILGTLCSVCYYALQAVHSPNTANATVILGAGPIALMTGLCGLTYFEFDHHMNAPAKLAMQLACVATMLFLTAELRALLNRHQPRRYLATACTALFANACALTGAAPALLYPDQAVHSTRILGLALLCLCNGMYVAYRLFAFSAHCNTPAPTDSPNTPEQTQGKDDQEDGCEQQDPMAS